MSQETDVSIVRAIERLEDKFSQKIDNLEQRLGQKLEQELGKVNVRIDNLEQKFEQKLDNLEQKIEQKLEQELGKVNVRIDNLEQKFEQKLEQGLEKVSDNIDKNSAEIVDVKIAIAKVDASLSEWRPSIQKIPDLAEKIGESKNWRQIVIIAITAIVTWLVKEGFKLN